MAKDGTNRGGARVGAGRKSKALVDKMNVGQPATIISLPDPPAFTGEDVPPIKEYLTSKQKTGKDLCAAEQEPGKQLHLRLYNQTLRT